jgi:hypothetical protein
VVLVAKNKARDFLGGELDERMREYLSEAIEKNV